MHVYGLLRPSLFRGSWPLPALGFLLFALGASGCPRESGPSQKEWSGSFESVVALSEGTCALRAARSGSCWGDAHATKIVPPEGPFQKLSSAGGYRVCGLRPDGSSGHHLF